MTDHLPIRRCSRVHKDSQVGDVDVLTKRINRERCAFFVSLSYRSKRCLPLLCLLALLWPLVIPAVSYAAGACSSAMGKVVLNEYADQQNYVEAFQISSGYNMTGWKVRIYTSAPSNTSTCGSGCAEKTLPAAAANTCGDYQVVDFASNQTSTTADIVLLDSNNDVVDILRARAGSTINTLYPKPSCSFVGPSTDLASVNAANKGVDRLPNGTGRWRNTPGTGSGSYLTRCGANQADLTTTADLVMTKTANKSSVAAAGENVVFTLTVKNNGPDAATNLQVADVLQSGLSYVSNTTPSVGSFNAVTLLWDIASLAVNASASMTITTQVTNIGSWSNTATAKSDNTDPTAGNNTAIATVSLGTVAPQKFSACESGTCGNSSRLYTKLADAGFSLNLAALNSSGVPESTFNSQVTVDLLANSLPTSKGSNNCPDSQTASIALGPVSFAGGTANVNVPMQGTAYRDVAVRFSCAAGACPPSGLTWCAPDVFAIRPSVFTVISANANADSTGALSTASPAIKTGAFFAMTATAIAGYDGTPLVDNSKLQAHSGAIQIGSLTGSFTAASAATGVASGSNFTYSEVGYFALGADGVHDDTYTAVDPSKTDCTADFSNNLVGGMYGCKFGNTVATSYFGRFIPDHFDTVTSGGMPCPTGLVCPTQFNGFVYSGQPFTTKVTAFNLVGTKTANYDGTLGYAKNITLSAWNAVGGAAANPGGGTLSSNTLSASAFTGGIATTLIPLYKFPTTPIAPTDIYVRADEPIGLDGVSSLRGALSVEGGIKVVSGRVDISNAYGSELLDLPMTATAQYYSGTRWLTSATDSVTNLTLGLLNYQSKSGGAWATTPVPASGSISAGILSFTLSKPTGGGTGSVDVNISSPSYLLTGSNVVAVNPSNNARATFGIYKGNSKFIYIRELY